jgi:hypothetical protein
VLDDEHLRAQRQVRLQGFSARSGAAAVAEFITWPEAPPDSPATATPASAHSQPT